MHREENDANFWNRHFQHRCGFRSVHFRHRKVEKNQIRLECSCFFYGLEPVGGFTANGYIGPSCENVFDRLSNETAVVGDQQLLWHKQISVLRVRSSRYPVFNVGNPTFIEIDELQWLKAQSSALLEDDSFVSVEQDAIFDVPADGSGENYFFDVAALFHQVVDRVAVRYPFDALFDDGAVIEHFGDIVGCGANDFHAAIEGLLMGLCADECGQEGMMDIDDLLGELCDEIRGKHLHVASQDDEFDIVLAKQFDLLPFCLRLVFLGNGNHAIGNAIKVCVGLRVGMIADYQGDFAGEFAGALPVEQIDEAVIVFGNKNGHARTVVRGGDAPLNGKLLGDGSKPFWKILEVELETCEIPFDAREIETFDAGLVLLEMKDVAAVPVNEIRDCGIEALSIRAPQ